MKAKQFFAMAISSILLVSSMVACQPGGSNGPANIPTEAVPKGDPVKITIGSQSQYQTTPCNWYETEVFQNLCKQANVTIEYKYYDDEKFSTLLAGSDLPDITFSYSPQKLPDIIESKLALDLKPYFGVYPLLNDGPYKQANEIISGYYGGEEKALYFLATYIGKELRDGGVENYRGFNLRWDWYKAIGAPEFHTVDEYIDVVEQMVKANPTTADGKKVYGTGITGTSFGDWYTAACFSWPAMSNLWTFGGFLYMEGFDDAKLYNGYTDLEKSAFWSAMDFYNKLYNRGLLDPDTFTMTGDQYTTKITAGQYATAMNWPSGDLYSAERAKDPDTLAGYIAVPTEAAFVFADYKQASGYFPSNFQFVSAKSKQIQGALSFLNVCHDINNQRMMFSGIEGVHWDKVDGVPTPKDSTLEMRAAGGDDWKKTGIGSPANFAFLQPSFVAPDGGFVDLFDSDEMRAKGLNPLQKDYADFYGVDYPAQACMKLANEGKTLTMAKCFSELNQACTETMPNDIQRILTQCNDILFKAIPALVQAKDAAEFKSVQDQVLADLDKAGEKTAWDWCLKANTKAQEFTKPILATLEW